MILQQVRRVLVKMSTQEKADALLLLAAVIAEAEEYPSAKTPKGMTFTLLVAQLTPQECFDLVVVIGCSLRHPELLFVPEDKGADSDNHAMN